ncbi:methylamine utilization protein MauE [Tumebacillus sp. BK434]|uniref:MauE/DoxX family redox-associated membrane protein n=1 Tax=Tumebacillus sp. BK434 TaxID=2512169 RepID=UPI00104BB215|nr:MauE/DoxX family redox-associated membrane protein [Tumebacillus sp. BK434]TCP58993.1 methylamine utilization protein MauE [Tumebacillus sp. BK434]
MEELILFWRIILAVLFLSSAVSKLQKMPEHFAILQDYQILPASAVRPFGWLEVGAELLVGSLLVLGWLQPLTAWVTAGLLLMYSAAVAINLLRGRREISCGCGGVAGNHQLSWKLVARNVLLMLVCGFLAQYTATYGLLDPRFWITALVSITLLLIGMGTLELRAVRRRMQALTASEFR